MQRIRLFLLGLTECRSSFGMTYDNDPDSPRSRAYDRGRSLGCWVLNLDDDAEPGEAE